MIPDYSWVRRHTNLIDVIDIQYRVNNKKDILLQIKQKVDDHKFMMHDKTKYYIFIPNNEDEIP
jgi:hypothetical protein